MANKNLNMYMRRCLVNDCLLLSNHTFCEGRTSNRILKAIALLKVSKLTNKRGHFVPSQKVLLEDRECPFRFPKVSKFRVFPIPKSEQIPLRPRSFSPRRSPPPNSNNGFSTQMAATQSIQRLAVDVASGWLLSFGSIRSTRLNE